MVADLVLRNGRIYTVDPHRSWAQAVAMKGGKIVAVGGDLEAEGRVGPDTKVIDLQGRMVLPGLGDVHNHHTMAGQQDLYEVSFPPSHGFDQILDCVAAKAAQLGPDEWISTIY